MNIGKCNIPDREIGEHESQLLDEIWTELSSAGEPEDIGHRGFEDLQDRIHRKSRQKKIYRLTAWSGVAAVIAICFFVFQNIQGGTSASEVYVQLQEMEICRVDKQVVLMMGDGKVVPLDSAAVIKTSPQQRIALQTSDGKKISLVRDRKLKIEVPVGRRFDLTLADGTRVWLNAGSTFEYPATFDGCSERCVYLKGEAFFEVHRDTTRPFLVNFGKNETIRVLGTSFNVTAYEDSEEHITTLASGKISFSSEDNPKPVVLVPNQQVRLNCFEGTTEICQVDASVYGAWKDGWIWFENEPLEKLATRFGRLYGIEIQVADQYKHETFSGKIRFERGIDYITQLLSKTTSIICVVEDGVLKLK